MSDTSEVNRERLLARLRELIAAGRAEFESGRGECRVEVNGVELAEYPLDKLDLQTLSTAELTLLEDYLRWAAQFSAYAKTPEFRLQMEHLGFALQLHDRQGTHLPNFDQFYGIRDEIDRRLFDVPDHEQ